MSRSEEESLRRIAAARQDGPLNLLVILDDEADDQTVLDTINLVAALPAAGTVGLTTFSTGTARVQMTTKVGPGDFQPTLAGLGKAAAWQNDQSHDTNQVFVWLSRDQDGYEGIIAVVLPKLGVTPMVFASERLAREAEPAVRNAAIARGFAARLVRFTRADTVLTSVDPGAVTATRTADAQTDTDL